MSENATLTPRQNKAIECLLTCASVEEAAVQAKVNKTTIYRWVQQKPFSSELRRRQRLVLDVVVSSLSAMATDATAAYRDALHDENISTRLRAAESLFSHLLKLSEVVTLAQRVEELEELLHET